MKFKSANLVKEYDILPEKLKAICEFFVKISKENGITALVTRITDPVEGESGVHLDHRAVDFRNQYSDGKSLRCLYSIELVDEILETINNLYVRDDKFLVAIHHSFKGGMLHFHLQIPAKWVTSIDRIRIKNGVS